MAQIAIKISFFLYLAAFIIGLFEQITNGKIKYAVIFFSLALGVNLFAIVSRGISIRQLPFAGRYQAMTLYVFATAFVALLISSIYRNRQVVLAVTPLLLILLILALTAQRRTPTPLPPILRTPLFGIHVILVFFGYACYTVNFSLCFLIYSKKMDVLRIIDKTVESGTLLIGMGIAIGAIWAAVSWGNWWAWDPKETWALITFLIYVMYIHLRNKHELNRIMTVVFLVAGFISLTITFLGINLLKWSIHSY